MNEREMKEMLKRVADGELSVEDACLKLREAPFGDIDFAKPDHHRGIRQGIGEIVYGAGKTPEQIRRIALDLWEKGQKTVLITRMNEEAAALFDPELPFTYYKEILRNYRRILPQLNAEKIRNYAESVPKSDKVIRTIQTEVY